MIHERKQEEKKNELPYAEQEAEPERWAIDALLAAENDLPQDILDCCAKAPSPALAAATVAEYRAFESQLEDVIYDQGWAMTDEYKVRLPAHIEPGSAECTLFLAKVDKMWQVKKRPGYCGCIRICICGSTTCNIGPHSNIIVRFE